MLALIRTKADPNVGIRCNFDQVVDSRNSSVVFSNISEYGLSKLKPDDLVKVEVVGMPSKVIFQTRVDQVNNDSIRCDLPKSLISIERRSSARIQTKSKLMAYMKLSVWEPDILNVGTPPSFPQYNDMHKWVPILDLSTGGACLSTRFPSLLQSIANCDHDPHALLILPMIPAIAVATTFRWHRRVRSRISENKDERYALEFKVGIEFNNLSDEDSLKLKQFIRQLSIADAI